MQIGYNPFVRFERLALQKSHSLLDNQDKMKYLRKSETYDEDNIATYQIVKFKRPQDAILATINSQRKAVGFFERKLHKKNNFEVYEEIKAKLPNEKAQHLLSPKWQRKAFNKPFI